MIWGRRFLSLLYTVDMGLAVSFRGQNTAESKVMEMGWPLTEVVTSGTLRLRKFVISISFVVWLLSVPMLPLTVALVLLVGM